MTEDKPDPLARKTTRMPLSPTIRPGLIANFGQGGISTVLYALVAVALIGFALYQVRVQHLEWSNWRVLVAGGGALYFAVRAAMMAALNHINKDFGDDEKGEGG